MSDDSLSPIKVEGGPIEPAALQAIVMLQVSNRLRRVAESLERQASENKSTSAELQITEDDQIYEPAFPLFGITVRNDGPSSIYVSINTPLLPLNLHAPIMPDEVFSQNGTRANISRAYLRCPAGMAAKIRIWGYA